MNWDPHSYIQYKDNIAPESDPFPHIVLDDFFTDTFYADFRDVFQQSLGAGLSEERDMQKFTRFSGYDAYSFTPKPTLEYPLGLFYSREWAQYMADIFKVPISNDITFNFHHHTIGSTNGFVHNDYNLCAFKDDPLPNGMNCWYDQCIYTDDTDDKQPDTFKRMRSIVWIYFLENAPWKEGDGGETGLYRDTSFKSLQKKVAPINNRLLAFETAPNSYHGFLKNVSHERNSAIQWLHENPISKIHRHGNAPYERWK